MPRRTRLYYKKKKGAERKKVRYTHTCTNTILMDHASYCWLPVYVPYSRLMLILWGRNFVFLQKFIHKPILDKQK